MGYDLFITRAEFWADNEAAPIEPEEWLAVVDDDPELALGSEGSGPYFAEWSGASIHAQPWLDWSEGNIYTKNPDRPLIRKMVAIAERLQARVQGEEGEEYDGTEEGFPG